jgi:MFS family permease
VSLARSEPDSGYAWIVACASVALASVGAGSYFLISLALAPISAALGAGTATVSLAYSAAMLGMGLGGIAAGAVADRYGVARPLAFGVFGVAGGAYWAGQSESVSSLVLAYGLAIGALGNAAFVTPLYANITRWFVQHRGLAAAIVGSGQALGGTYWPPIFRYAMDVWGWRATYRGYAFFALCAALPLCLLLRRSPPEAPVIKAEAGVAERPVLGLAPTFALGLLCIAIIGCCIAMSMPLVHLVNHAEALEITRTRAALMLSLLMAVSGLARLSWGAVIDRIGALQTLLITSTLQATALALMALSTRELPLFAVSVFFGLGFGGLLPCYPLILREYFPIAGLGWRVGVVIFFGTIGMALGPPIAGAVFDELGSYSLGFGVGVAANLVNLVIIGALNLRRRRHLPLALPA